MARKRRPEALREMLRQRICENVAFRIEGPQPWCPLWKTRFIARRITEDAFWGTKKEARVSSARARDAIKIKEDGQKKFRVEGSSCDVEKARKSKISLQTKTCVSELAPAMVDRSTPTLVPACETQPAWMAWI